MSESVDVPKDQLIRDLESAEQSISELREAASDLLRVLNIDPGEQDRAFELAECITRLKEVIEKTG